ncbi:MAG: helix-turn-helix domain-containing protein [Chloroflexota bacterium]
MARANAPTPRCGGVHRRVISWQSARKRTALQWGMPFQLEDLDPATRAGLETLGAAMANLRGSRGISQHLLSRRSGVSQSSISRLEAGKAPWMRARHLARMLTALGVGPLEIDFRPPDVRVPSRDPILEFVDRMYRRDNTRRR